jgi:ABC-type transport system substrate-binding protein
MSGGAGSLALLLLFLVHLVAFSFPGAAADPPAGQMTWAVHTTLVPTWFDPAETIQQTPFMVLSATHDGLFREQATELDRSRREATLHRMQQLIHERAMFAPIWDFAFLHGVGPRVDEAGLGLLGGYGFSAPYEDVKLKGK